MRSVRATNVFPHEGRLKAASTYNHTGPPEGGPDVRLLRAHHRTELRHQLVPAVASVCDVARRETDPPYLLIVRQAIAAADVDDVLHVHQSVGRMLVEIG